MGVNSSIQWTDHTWNIAIGCEKVDSDCKYCYMYRDSLKGTRWNPKKVTQTKLTGVFREPYRRKNPAKIFTSSLTDILLKQIDSYRHLMWQTIADNPWHTFQLLTKRTERILETLPDDWGAGYPNVWYGTSIGHQAAVHRAYQLIDDRFHARIKFLSLEPLYEPLADVLREVIASGKIQWVIIGGESGNEKGPSKYRPCRLEWIEDLIELCREYAVPVFVKQLGTHLSKQLGLSGDRHGGKMEHWPDHLRVREFPEVSTSDMSASRAVSF